MRVDFRTSLIKLFTLARFIGYKNIFCQNASSKRTVFRHIFRDAYISRFIKSFNNFFSRVKYSYSLFAIFVRRRKTQSSQKHSRQNFLFSVEFCKNKIVFLVDFKLKPRSAIRDNPTGIHTLIMRKNNTRRAVNLSNHNALCTIYDKSSTVGHQRNIAHVNFLAAYFMRFGKHQVNFRFQWHRIRKPFLLTFKFRKLNAIII